MPQMTFSPKSAIKINLRIHLNQCSLRREAEGIAVLLLAVLHLLTCAQTVRALRNARGVSSTNTLPLHTVNSL